VPTDADLQRFYEVLPGLNRGRHRVGLCLLPPAIALSPWLGPPNVIMVIGLAIVGFVTNRYVVGRTSTVAEGIVIAAAFQSMLSIGVAITGGLLSPYLSWLVVPVTMLSARYRHTVVIAATVVALLLGAVCCALANIAGTARNHPPLVLGVTTIALLCALGTITLNLQSAEMESRRAASSDPLTGLLNRKTLTTSFVWMARDVAATDSWLSMLVLDLDHFKAINDTHGHATGDEVLRQAARSVTSSVRPQDRIFRVGGEEFLVLLPHAGAELGTAVAERIRKGLAAARLAGLDVTVSIGVAAARARAADERTMLEAADAALYAAKAAGRNRVVCADG
jgi:diguanylate cyclase (GGDEF)-like protein